MDTRKTILVPLDGTTFSQSILDYVMTLFPSTTYKLILLQIAEPVAAQLGVPPRPIDAPWGITAFETTIENTRFQHPIYVDQVEHSARATYMHHLEHIARGVALHGYAVTCEVWFGIPAEGIISYATAQHVDVIAMATHARSGVSHLLLGSVAEAVLRHVNIPVLLVHPDRERSEAQLRQREEPITPLLHTAK